MSAENPTGFVQTGIASFYGRWHAGRKTSSGERFNPWGMTCAHRTLPMHAKVLVTDLDSGNSLVLMVNDRGPYVHHRVLDLSEGAAHRLGIHDEGIAHVRIERLGTSGNDEVAMMPDDDERPMYAHHASHHARASHSHHGRRHRR